MQFGKENILAGDVDQLLTVLHTRYIRLEQDSSKSVEDVSRVQRLSIASAIYPERSIAVDWGDKGLSALVNDINQEFSPVSLTFNAEIKFSRQMLEGINKQIQLDKQLLPHLAKLQEVILAHALADSKFWIKPHPLLEALDFLHEQMIGWQDSFGRSGDNLRDIFVSAVDRLLSVDLMDTGKISQVMDEVKQEFAAATNKVEKLSKRLNDTETGLLKNRFAQREVTGFMNKICRGKQLPPMVISYLHEHLLNEMKLLVIKEGGHSSSWMRWKKLFESLVNLYQPATTENLDEITKNQLQQVPDDIGSAVEGSIPKSQKWIDFINQVAFDFANMMMGEKVAELQDVPELESEQIADVDTQVSKQLLAKARSCKVGQWFIYVDDERQVKRARLSLSLPAFGQLMFCNAVGQKAFTASFEEFAYLLSTKKVKPLRSGSIVEFTRSALLDRLLDDFDNVYETRQSEIKRREYEAKQEAERKAKEEAEAKAEAERIAAAEKARAEAEAIAERKAAEEQRALMIQIADDLRRQARLALDSLSLGSWIEWQNPETKDYKRIKLALKFNATGRFVFVDEDGINVAEHVRDELVDMMMNRKIKLLDSDTKFADRLSKIVTTIRSNSE